jgi:thioesterase domain-containing protein/acyl carrier protein
MTTSRLETSNAGLPSEPESPSPGGHQGQNLVEQILLEIWNTALGRTNITPTDQFFEIGGDSLLALVTIEQINQRLGWSLELSDLLRYPSVRGLAANKALPQAASAERAIVRMRNAGSRTPIIFIHPMTGLVFAYSKLAHHLGEDRGCYGIQSPMYMGSSVPSSIEGLAEIYADLIADELGEEPFHLVSWSAGGTISLELAKHVSTRGLGLRKLVFIDTFLWNALPIGNASPLATTEQDTLAEFYDNVLAQVPHVRPDRTMPAGYDAAAAFHDLSVAMFGGDAGVQFVQRLYEAYRATYRAVGAYHPTPVPGEALLLIGAENDTLGAWRSVMSSGLTVERLDDDHFGLLREPEASKIAARIDAYCQ